MSHLHLVTDNEQPDRDWSWVVAGPFRAHLRRILDETGLPWRVLAGYAHVPDNVVRALLGREGRPRLRRLAPHYAERLLRLDPAVIARDLAAPGSPVWARAAIRALLGAGWTPERIRIVAGLSRAQVTALSSGRSVPSPAAQLSRRSELLLSAAVRAHGLAPGGLADPAVAA